MFKNIVLFKDVIGDIMSYVKNLKVLTLALVVCSVVGVSSVNAAPVRIPKDILSLESKCNGGDVNSCLKAGDIFKEGKRVRQNLDRAAKLYTKGCDLKSGVSCEQAVGAYTQKGSKEDGQKIIKLIRKACDLDMKGSCTFIEEHPEIFNG